MKISINYIDLLYYNFIKVLLKNNKDLISIILNIDKDDNDLIMNIVNIINNLINIDEIIYSYVKYIIYPIFFKISLTQYNISTIDILGESFTKNKITFSGTVDFELPYNIITELINYNEINENKNNVINCCLKKIKNNDSLEKFKNIFFRAKKIIKYKKYTNIEICLSKYLFNDNNIIKYDSLIDVGGFFIRNSVINIVELIFDTFKNNNIHRKIIYINKDNEKMIYDGNYNKYNNEIDDIFIYYDNKHTIGIDFKQPYNMNGLVTINKLNTLTEVMQGIFRLRNIEKGHNINYFYNYKDNIELKDIYKKLIKNSSNKKKNSKNKMQYQCIKYLNRSINKKQSSYFEHIYHDSTREHINNIKSYKDFINLMVNNISKLIKINIKKIIIKNEFIDSSININTNIDINVNKNININIETNKIIGEHKRNTNCYIYNIIDLTFNDYFDITFFKDSKIFRITDIYENYKNHIINYEIYIFFRNILKGFNNINTKNFINTFISEVEKETNLSDKNFIEKFRPLNVPNKILSYTKKILNKSYLSNPSNIIKKIDIKLNGIKYDLSPYLFRDNSLKKNKLFSLLIYNDLRLLLTSSETYEIISELLNNKNIKIDINDLSIYSVLNCHLIYGTEKNILKDHEKLLLGNFKFNIDDTLNILFNNDIEKIYDILELIEFISEKYYFNINELKNNKIDKINFFKLFYIDENINIEFKSEFIDIVENIRKKYLYHKYLPYKPNHNYLNKLYKNEKFRINFERIIKKIGVDTVPILSPSERLYIYNILINLNKTNDKNIQKNNIFRKLENSSVIINKNEENQKKEIRLFINEIIDKFFGYKNNIGSMPDT